MNKESYIVALDDLYVIAYKAPSVSCTPDCTDGTDLQSSLETELEQSLHIITRIDKPVSGLVLYARNVGAAQALTEMIKQKKIQKSYLAVVEGVVKNDTDTITHRLIKGTNHKAYENPEGKEAQLSYSRLFDYDKYTLLSIQTGTGRFHQIRCQLSLIGHSIKGDVKYGARRGNPDRSIHLHVQSLGFKHPFTQEDMLYTCLPDDSDTLWRIAIEHIVPQ